MNEDFSPSQSPMASAYAIQLHLYTRGKLCAVCRFFCQERFFLTTKHMFCPAKASKTARFRLRYKVGRWSPHRINRFLQLTFEWVYQLGLGRQFFTSDFNKSHAVSSFKSLHPPFASIEAALVLLNLRMQ